MNKNKHRKKGYSLVESMVTLGIFSVATLIFTQTVMSVQKASAVINRQIELREESDLVRAKIEWVLYDAFYFFEKEHMYTGQFLTLPAVVYQKPEQIFSDPAYLPSDPDTTGAQPGNCLYFLTQEIKPLASLVPAQNIKVNSTAGLSNLALQVLQKGIPDAIKNSQIRTLQLHILYLRKQKKTDSFNQGAQELVHAWSNYPIYHKSAEGDTESGIIFPPDAFVSSDSQNSSSLLTGLADYMSLFPDVTTAVNTYKSIIYRILDENTISVNGVQMGFSSWTKPDSGALTDLPSPVTDTSQDFTETVIASDIAARERINISPSSNIAVLPGSYANPQEFRGLSFQYLNQADDQSKAPDQQKISSVVKVVMHFTKYSPKTRSYINEKNEFKVVPRNLQKKSAS